jgi:DNA-binding CsgD family transcriptional regulator
MIERIVIERIEIREGQFVPSLLEPLVAAAGRGEDVLPYVKRVVASFGFEQFSYGVSASPHPDRNATNYMYSTMSDAWHERYERFGYIERDTRRFLTCKSAVPLIWDQSNVRGLGPHVDEFVEDARRFGIASGVSFMIHGTCESHAILAFDSSLEHNDEIRLKAITRNLPDLHMFGSYFHEFFMVPAIMQRGRRAPRPELSGRERECLELAAQGLTTKEISARLAISARTVQFHFGRICAKLDVTNRQGAIAVAVREQLLGASVQQARNLARIASKARLEIDVTRSPSTTRAARPPIAPSRAV